MSLSARHDVRRGEQRRQGDRTERKRAAESAAAPEGSERWEGVWEEGERGAVDPRTWARQEAAPGVRRTREEEQVSEGELLCGYLW